MNGYTLYLEKHSKKYEDRKHYYLMRGIDCREDILKCRKNQFLISRLNALDRLSDSVTLNILLYQGWNFNYPGDVYDHFRRLSRGKKQEWSDTNEFAGYDHETCLFLRHPDYYHYWNQRNSAIMGDFNLHKDGSLSMFVKKRSGFVDLPTTKEDRTAIPVLMLSFLNQFGINGDGNRIRKRCVPSDLDHFVKFY